MNGYIEIGSMLSNVLWGATAIFMVFATFRVQSHLKRNHHEVYVSLGSPTAIVGRNNPNKGKFWKYVQSKEYAGLGDEKLNNLIRIFKWSYIAFVIACVPFLIFNFLM